MNSDYEKESESWAGLGNLELMNILYFLSSIYWLSEKWCCKCKLNIFFKVKAHCKTYVQWLCLHCWGSRKQKQATLSLQQVASMDPYRPLRTTTAICCPGFRFVLPLQDRGNFMNWVGMKKILETSLLVL